MKKMLALLLAVVMLLSCFAGCGGTKESAVSEVPVSEASESVVAEAQETPQEAPTAEEVPQEEVASVEEVEVVEEPKVVIEYPIEGDVTISVWKPFETMMFGELMSSFYEMPMHQNIVDATGVNLEYVSVSDIGSYEQFNLMIASGDWCDLTNLSNYTGGLAKAYEDNLCYDLTDYLDEYMPDFKAALEELKLLSENGYKSTRTDDGQLLATYTIYDEYVQEQGLVYRSDWAEEIGMEDIVTIEDLEAYLEYATNTYMPQFGMTASNGGVIDGITGAFKTTSFDASGSSVDLGLYLEDSKVTSAITAESTKEYIRWFNEMYEMGAIYADFFNMSTGPDWVNSYFSGDDVAISFLRSDKISTIVNDSTTEGFALSPTTSIVQNEGDTFTFGDLQTVVMANFSVMSTTEHLEECLYFLNWFYTEDGYELSNYGEENLSFVYNEDGSVAFTDIIVNSTYRNKVQVKNIYGAMIYPFVKDVDSFFYTYADIEQEAMDIWSEISDESRMPSFELSGDAASEVSTLASDIVSYAATQVMKWFVGEEELTDEAWDNYVATCEGMGIADAVAIYQEGYESFMAR